MLVSLQYSDCLSGCSELIGVDQDYKVEMQLTLLAQITTQSSYN